MDVFTGFLPLVIFMRGGALLLDIIQLQFFVLQAGWLNQTVRVGRVFISFWFYLPYLLGFRWEEKERIIWLYSSLMAMSHLAHVANWLFI
jgi:hypothetical protein